jgi:hypothetical protein
VDWMLVLLAYMFGAVVTGAWSVGFGGIGRDIYDRAALVAVALGWPISWLLAAGSAIADWEQR